MLEEWARGPFQTIAEMGSERKVKRHARQTNMCLNPSPWPELQKKGNGRGTFEEITAKCFLELKNKPV